jgi:HPt (histidine-containing phosphotransfer) domain-containing protein
MPRPGTHGHWPRHARIFINQSVTYSRGLQNQTEDHVESKTSLTRLSQRQWTIPHIGYVPESRYASGGRADAVELRGHQETRMSREVLRDFGMRDSRTVRAAKTASVPGRPIDLVHLARQTLGDRVLEGELLGLFERQAGQILDQILAASAAGDRRYRHDLAHTLKGSAMAVGAENVARMAQSYEDALYKGEPEAVLLAARDALAAAVREARAAVRDLLADR